MFNADAKKLVVVDVTDKISIFLMMKQSFFAE